MNLKKYTFIFSVIALLACNKSIFNFSENYESIDYFFAKNAIPKQVFTLNGTTGVTIITSQGTMVIIPPNTFLGDNGVTATGSITLNFIDVYKKSDMILSVFNHTPSKVQFKTGGQFFIEALQNVYVRIDSGKSIIIKQPVNKTGSLDSFMQGYRGGNCGSAKPGWMINPDDSFSYSPGFYVYDLHNLNGYSYNYCGSGTTWCGTEDSTFFHSFPQTTLTVKRKGPVDVYTYVFIVFKNFNSIVRLENGVNFVYEHAPLGQEATLVALAIKDGSVYSAFIPITISANKSVDLSLSRTTTNDFKAKLRELD